MDELDAYLPGIVAGDADAFARWLAGAERSLRGSLRPFARRLDTEALLQETLLRVWQTAARVTPDGRGNALLRWGLRIGRNLALSELRRARVDPAEIEVLEREAGAGEGTYSVASWPDPLLRALLEECRRQLPRQPARALEARIGGGGRESDATLAARARMKRNTFLQNVGRARRLLAACLAARGVELA